MDTRKVQIFIRAVESGSLMSIAEELGYTPSGLTQMMNALERELDIRLIERNHQGIRLTPDGAVLFPILKKYVSLEDSLRENINRLKQKKDMVLRIGSYRSIAKNWVPQIIDAFWKAHPGVKIELELFGRPEAYQGLKSGRLSLIFASYDQKSKFDFIPLKKDYYCAVLPPNLIDLSKYEFLPLKEFERYKFIVPSYGIDVEALEVLKQNDVHPQFLPVEADDLAVIHLVAEGLGISILSELILEGNHNIVDSLPIQPRVYRELGIAVKSMRKLSLIEKKFINVAKNIHL